MTLTFEKYINQPVAERVVLVEISKGASNYYFSDHAYVTEPGDSLSNVLFEAIIAKDGIPRFRWKMANIMMGQAEKNYGSLVLSSYLLHDGTDLRSIDLSNADVTVKLAAPRSLYPYSDAVVLFTGTLTKQKCHFNGRITYGLSDKQHYFDAVMIPKNNYTSGPDSTIGRPIPVGLGSVFNATPVLIDDSNLWYQFHDTGDLALDPLNVTHFNFDVFDNGVRLILSGNADAGSINTIVLPVGFSTVDDYYNGAEISIDVNFVWQGDRTIIDYDGATRTATLDSDLISPVSVPITTFILYPYERDFANGRIRLLSVPAGDVTVTFFGAQDSSGNYTNTPEELVTLLCTHYLSLSVGDIDIDLPSIAGNTYVPNIYLDNYKSITELISELLFAEMAWWSFNRSGKFVSRYLIDPSGQGTPYSFDLAEIIDLQMDYDDKIFWKLSAEYALNHTIINNPADSLTEYEKSRIKYESKLAVKEVATVKTNYPESKEKLIRIPSGLGSVDSYLTYLHGLYDTRRYTLKITVPLKLPLLDIGDVVKLNTNDAYDGKWRVDGIIDRVGGKVPVQELELWR